VVDLKRKMNRTSEIGDFGRLLVRKKFRVELHQAS
jgi:hypothetical protein